MASSIYPFTKTKIDKWFFIFPKKYFDNMQRRNTAYDG